MNNLDDIFNDETFEQLTASQKKAPEKQDPEVTKFLEIQDFVKEHGREPQKTPEWSNERALWARLNGFREKTERATRVRNYDALGLLGGKSAEHFDKESLMKVDSSVSLDDIFEEDLFSEKLSGLLDVSRYKRTVNAADKRSSRKRMANFAPYQPLFEKVHEELATGVRKLVNFKEYDIKAGRFYVDNGILLYVKSVSDTYTDKNGDPNAKLHVIFENGTENKELLLRSLASSLYEKGRHGRMVTEVVDDETLAELFGTDYTTGYIYVLKSLSTAPEIQQLNHLHKIGFTRNDIHTRIANAEKELTYLKAPVQVVMSVEVKNVNAQLLERTLHHTFQAKQVLFQNSAFKKATEWYLVTLDEIEKTIHQMMVELQIDS